MIQWLYRYIFRGLGVAFLIGVLTLLYLAVNSQMKRQATNPATASRPHR
jgi:hypothetical protein